MKNRTAQLITFAAAACLSVMPFFSFAEVKALSFAINESNGSGDGTKIKDYMGSNDIDFGVFDYAKLTGYFISDDFVNEGRNFKVANCDYGGGNNHNYKFAVWNSDKYELVSSLVDYKSGENVAAVFRDEFGDEFALLSVRGTYKDDKVSATLGPVKTYIEDIMNAWPDAKTIVTYNARLSGTYNGNSYSNIVDTYLTETATGPQMTRLGRTSGGGAYMYPVDIPTSSSVEAVDSIGTTYPGLLVTLTYPTKCKVIFNDWDGTGLQTNIVFAGDSVTPPTVPGREGYTFTGWDHPASDFESVPSSFTATAQYAENAAWLLVSGEPENLGTADPAYGTLSSIAASDVFTASVAAPAVEEDATERWVCTGYTHYEITDVATGAKTVAQEGNTASFAYTHVFQDELVWHFTNEWLVAVSATVGGSVSASAETWVRNGEALRLVATPDQGWEFLGWRGDTNGIADVSSASIAPVITSARSLRALFAPTGADASVQYVATTGNDANSGYFKEFPKATVQAAVNTLAGGVGNGIVHVAAGIYPAPQSVVVTNAISVLGETGSSEDVVLRNTSTTSGSNVITLRLDHPLAFVANLVVENGHRYQPQNPPYGANLAIESKGGTVSNCVIRGGVCQHFYPRGAGAWLNSDAALLTHCVVSNNSANGASKARYANDGMFVHVDKGTVANCLIAGNRDSGTGSSIQTCGVTIGNGGRILDSTVVANEAPCNGGVYLFESGYATNVVVAGCVNTSTSWTDVGFSGKIANASHCASDGGEALDSTTCVVGTAAEFFRDFSGGDYRPALDSPLINKGVAYDDIASFDLLGKKRVQGRAPDIGCFESAPSGLSVVIR